MSRRLRVRLSRVLLFALVVVACGIEMHGQSTRAGTVQGRVTEVNGFPMPGVTITATATAWQREAITDTRGEFLIEGVPDSVEGLTVSASLIGFVTSTRRVPVSQQPPVFLDFVMEAACLEIVDRVQFDFAGAMKAAGTVVHVQVLSAVPWSRPGQCGTERATEHAATVANIVTAGDDVRLASTFHILAFADAAKLTPRGEYVLLLSWDDKHQRFIAWPAEYTLTIYAGRIVSDDVSRSAAVDDQPLDTALKRLRAMASAR